MTEAYDGRQVVGMDLHRRRSVLVRMTEDGRKLETVRITNSPAALRRGDRQGREAPAGGARGHVRLVLGRGRAARRPGRRCTWRIRWVSRRSATGGSRTTSGTPRTWRTCCGWAGCREAWIAPPEIRELRELTRYRHKLVGLRTSLQGPGARGAGQARHPGHLLGHLRGARGRRGWMSWTCRSRTRARSPRCGS